MQSSSVPKIILSRALSVQHMQIWGSHAHQWLDHATCELQSLWKIQLPWSALCYSAADLYTKRKYYKANLNQVPLLGSVHLADTLSLKVTCRRQLSAAFTFLMSILTNSLLKEYSGFLWLFFYKLLVAAWASSCSSSHSSVRLLPADLSYGQITLSSVSSMLEIVCVIHR